jgi:hypothetical protein
VRYTRRASPWTIKGREVEPLVSDVASFSLFASVAKALSRAARLLFRSASRVHTSLCRPLHLIAAVQRSPALRPFFGCVAAFPPLDTPSRRVSTARRP